jgi:hypothetical protein
MAEMEKFIVRVETLKAVNVAFPTIHTVRQWRQWPRLMTSLTLWLACPCRRTNCSEG